MKRTAIRVLLADANFPNGTYEREQWNKSYLSRSNYSPVVFTGRWRIDTTDTDKTLKLEVRFPLQSKTSWKSEEGLQMRLSITSFIPEHWFKIEEPYVPAKVDKGEIQECGNVSN